MYPTLIVDDEKHEQEKLVKLLHENFPQIDLLGIASSVDEGIEMIKSKKPVLVFLDVVMPPKTSFDLLESFPKIDFNIIFTTSYEEFAIKAFKFSAVDYLLKPFGIEDLRIAINKFEEIILSKNTLNHFELLLNNFKNSSGDNSRIALPTQTGYVFINVDEIIRCQSDNTYTTFFLKDKRQIVVSKTLKEYEELLSDYNFLRVHNSHIINLRYIKEYIKGEGGIAKMIDGAEVEISRRKKEQFLNALNKL